MNELLLRFQKRFHISQRKLNGIKYLLLASPFVLVIFAFSYVPLFGWAYAFFDYKIGQDLSQMTFTGLYNFGKLFTQHTEILRVLRNTIVMSLLNILFTPLPVIFAIMLNEIKNRKIKKFIQTTTTLPNFISWIVVYGLAFSFFSSSGMINTLLTALHIPTSTINLLGNNTWVWVFQLALGVWKGLGWQAIIYIASISSIDMELYDSAKVDGANKIQSILHITLPGLAPTYLVLLLLSVSNLLNNGFDQYYVFYNSLVADRIAVLDYYVYKIAFIVNDYSYSIAIGMLKSFISIMLLFTVNWISKKVRGASLV